MFLTPEVLRCFCAATEWFANLPEIGSTEQIEAGFRQSLTAVMRSVSFPDGVTIEPWFDQIEPQYAQAYRNDQLALQALLQRVTRLPSRAKNRYTWLGKSRQLRDELKPKLQRLLFGTTTGFNEDGSVQLFPSRFGLETVIYLTVAALLEPDSKGKAAKCGKRTCGKYVIHVHTGRGKPRTHCPDHAQSKRNQERRKPEMAKSVWLVRWEHMGDHAKPKKKIAMILPGDYEVSLVKTIVEHYYAAETSTPDELLSYATEGSQAYPGEVHKLAKGGHSVVCGHNPFLEARMVPGADSAKALRWRDEE